MLTGLGLSLPGCLGVLGGLVGAETLEWKEEAALHDGGTLLVVLRVHLLSGGPFQTMAGARRLTFAHPATGRPVVWENAGEIGSRLNPILLDVDAGRLFLVTMAQAVTDYNDLGCPTPPYIAFRYDEGTWVRVPLSDLPSRFERANLLGYPGEEVIREAHGYLTAAQVAARLNALRSRSDTEYYGRIDRRIRNPIGLGCIQPDRVYGKGSYDKWSQMGNWLDKSEEEVLRLLRRKGEGAKP
jgi:hypothetical protein